MNVTTTGSRRWWALAALALSVLVVGLDLFVLTLALPTLSADLHASSGDLQWFVDSYSLVLAAALLPFGLLGDKLGRKRMLIGALVVFGLASLGCAYSTSPSELIAARAVLGLAAAVILPMSLAVLPVMFTPQERPRAIAAVGGATFLGYPIGPILGGWLLDHYWWGSVFLINVPVVLIAIIAAATLMPESRGELASRLDLAGIAISSAGLTLLTYGVIKAGENGWSDSAAVATMAVGAVAVAVFVLWERRVGKAHEPKGRGGARTEERGGRAGRGEPAGRRRLTAPQRRAGDAAYQAAGDDRSRRPTPLIDLTLFNSAGFTWGTILATLVSFALFGLVFAMPLYFREIRGLDSLGAGVRMLPMIGGLVVGLALGQRSQTPRKARGRAAADPETGRPHATAAAPAPPVNPRIVVAVGFVIMAAALAVGARTTVASSSAFAATWFAITGFGLGLAMPTALNAALGALSSARSGSGSALMTAMRQVGGTIGVAVLGTALSTVYQGRLHLTGLPPAATAAVRSGVGEGVAIAQKFGLVPLLEAVRGAYVHGLDVMLWICAAIAVTSAVLGLLFLPNRADAPSDQVSPPAADEPESAALPALQRGE